MREKVRASPSRGNSATVLWSLMEKPAGIPAWLRQPAGEVQWSRGRGGKGTRGNLWSYPLSLGAGKNGACFSQQGRGVRRRLCRTVAGSTDAY